MITAALWPPHRSRCRSREAVFGGTNTSTFQSLNGSVLVLVVLVCSISSIQRNEYMTSTSYLSLMFMFSLVGHHQRDGLELAWHVKLPTITFVYCCTVHSTMCCVIIDLDVQCTTPLRITLPIPITEKRTKMCISLAFNHIHAL